MRRNFVEELNEWVVAEHRAVLEKQHWQAWAARTIWKRAYCLPHEPFRPLTSEEAEQMSVYDESGYDQWGYDRDGKDAAGVPRPTLHVGGVYPEANPDFAKHQAKEAKLEAKAELEAAPEEEEPEPAAAKAGAKK